jgi:hypothetical protein
LSPLSCLFGKLFRFRGDILNSRNGSMVPFCERTWFRGFRGPSKLYLELFSSWG